MSTRITSMDILNSMDKTIDTMLACHEINDQRTSAYARVVGHLTGVILDLAWDLSQEQRQDLINKFDKETQDYMHKITLETLRAKSKV